jgi:hypothetical protein
MRNLLIYAAYTFDKNIWKEIDGCSKNGYRYKNNQRKHRKRVKQNK